MYRKICDDLYQFKPGKLSSYCYLIRSDKNILIDSGTASDFEVLKSYLEDIGMSYKDIDIVINTHEHFDHIGGNLYLQENSIIMTHRLSAVKIEYGDDEVTMCRAHQQNVVGYRVDVWLNNTDVIKTNNWFLKVLYTPGHTSGCICLYEPRRKILFSGDTLFSRGTVSTIFNSGSLAEYLNSLQRLSTMNIAVLLPGHGAISMNVSRDIELSIKNNINRFPEAKYLSCILADMNI